MEKKTLATETKPVEQSLSRIGAAVADADDLSEKIGRLAAKQENILQDAQEQISDLYESLDEETPGKDG